MASLTTKQRRALPKSIFALPDERKYPLDTKGRAIDAKARALQQVKKGNLSKAKYAMVVAKANRVIKEDK